MEMTAAWNQNQEKSFGRTVCTIAVPVALQSMLQYSFSMVDQVMIGQLGSTSIAAVALAAKFSFLFSVIAGAVATVAGIMISQFLGANDEKESWRSFHVNMVMAGLAALIFTLAGLFLADLILSLYTEDGNAIAEGAVYLRIISFTFIPMAASTIAAAWLRCNEKASIPLYASFAAVVCNTGLNYILIFGKCGFAPMGSRGAGYATVISQFLNLTFMIIGFRICMKKGEKHMFLSLRLTKMTSGQYLMILLPILVNEFLWSLGENVYAAIYGHIGTASLAAATLTNPIQGLFTGALSGLSGAAAVIIGKQLGKKDYDQAYKDSKKLMALGMAGALILSVLLVAMSGCYVAIYQVEPEVKQLTKALLVIFAVFAPVKVCNMILGGGVIRSGGNTKIVMVIDLIGTWGFGVPLAFLTANVMKLSVPYVYAILSLEEVIRLGISIVIFRRRIWMQSIGVTGDC